MDAEIINVGTEMLIGDAVSNSQQFLISELANIDVNVYCTNTAGFDPQRLRELLSIALSRSDVIMIVGGMGPNVEDITKQTVCEALGIALVPHEISRKRIEEYCSHNGISLSPTILSMADMPAGSVVFRNDNGMCPGCAIRSSKQCIVMLPSSTVEIMPMVRSYVTQYLKQLTDGAVFSQVINIFYLGLSLHDVEGKLGGLLNSSNPTVKCVEMTGEVRIRVTAKTSSEQTSRELAAPVIRQILERFGDDAYGMNVSGLEEVVVRELKERKMTLSTAESCTAGIISKRITDIPGSSRVFEMGAATYSSNKKSDMLGVSEKIIQRYGAVSPEAAAAMAVGARRLAGSTLAVSTTGIAGPGGGTPLKPVGLVYIALADRENVWIKKTLIQKPGMDRDYVRQVAASHALNLVRKYINCLPYLMPGSEPLGEGVRESYFSEATAMSPQAMRNFAASVPVASLGGASAGEVPDSVREIVESATRRQQEIVVQPLTQIGSTTDPIALNPQSGISAMGLEPGMSPMGMNPMGMNQPGMNPMGMNPMGMNPMGMNPMGMNQPGMNQMGMNQMGMNPMGMNPMGMNPNHNPQKGQKKKESKVSGSQRGSYNSGGAAEPKPKASGAVAKSKSDIAYRIIFAVALLTLLGALSFLLFQEDGIVTNWLIEKERSERADAYGASEVVTSSDGVWVEPEEVVDDVERLASGALVKFQFLIEQNSDTVGWIKVPNTQIDYPVVKYADDANYAASHDNEYFYLHRGFDKQYNKDGTIFAFYGNVFERNRISRNTILFGHHMRDGTMFQNLMKYDPFTQGEKGLTFYKTNPVIRFDTIYDEGLWIVFAVLKADPETTATEFGWIHDDFSSDEMQQAFINEIRSRSILDTYSAIDVTTEDKLLIMQTCSYEISPREMRTLVVARRLRDDETTIDVSSVTRARNPVMPASM